MTSSGPSNNQRLHLHPLSAALIVKLDRLQFDQAVLDDTVVDIAVGNVEDMLLGWVDFESLGSLVTVSVALDILSAVDSVAGMYNNLLKLAVVLRSLVPPMKK